MTDVIGVTVNQLEVLLAVAERGSFTAAAVALGITQSAASRAVATLERHLGVPLLTRGIGGARLTARGRQVAEHARAALDQVRAIEALSRPEPAQRLRIGAGASASSHLVPAAVTRLAEDWPASDVLTVQGDDDELAGWLADATIDLAVTSTPIDSGDHYARTEITDDFLAALPGRHPLAQLAPVPLADLLAAGVADPGGTCGPNLAAGFAAHGLSWQPAHLVRDVETVLAMVRAGITAGILPALSVAATPAGVALLPLDPPLHRTLHVHHAPADELAGRLAAFLAHTEPASSRFAAARTQRRVSS